MWKQRERELDRQDPDVPPKALLLQHARKNASVNCDEFRRAQWFWERRPSKLVLSPGKAVPIGILYILLLITSVIVQNQSLATDVIRGVAWIVLAVIAVAVFVDITRYAQWKSEYRCAISRFLATIS